MPLEVREYPVLDPGPENLLLQCLASGICGTDIHILEGRLPLPGPFIPGHEFIGAIRACGADAAQDGVGTPLREGDRVVACVAQPCGECFCCRRGETASCLAFGVTNLRDPEEAPHFFGGFAEVLQQGHANCIRIPDELPVDAVAALPCAGPTAIQAFEYAGGLVAGEVVVVQGTGPVGLFAIAWAAAAGCEVVAIGSGRSPQRLELASALGAREVIDYRSMPVDARVEAVQALAGRLERGNGADVVFEATGSPTAVPEGMALCRTRGRYVVPGQYSQSGPVEIQPELITFKALRITGSGQYKLSDIQTYLTFLAEHPALQPHLAGLVSHRYTVEDANEAVAAVSRGETVKAVFVSEGAA